MTNLDALKAVVGIDGISDNSFQKALLDVSIDGTGTYNAANKKTLDTVAVELLKNILVQSVSEGGYSISYDRKAIEAKILSLSGAGVRGIQKVNI